MHREKLRKILCTAALTAGIAACAFAQQAPAKPATSPPPEIPKTVPAEQPKTAAPSEQPKTPAEQQPKPTTPAGQPQSAGAGGAAPQQPPAQNAAGQNPTFRVHTEMVTTDVIPRDGKGQFVADLATKDFEVYEDGVKQTIASMNLIHGGRVNSILSAAAPPQEEGIILPPSRPTNDAAGRIFIFFVDDLHLEFRNTGRLKKLLEQMGKTLLHDGDMFGIQTTGPSSVAVDLTYDRNRYFENMKRISGSELKPSEIIQGPESQDGPSEVRYRAHVAFSTVNELLMALEQVKNRRKALIYVSDGYDFNPFESARSGLDSSGSPNSPYLKRDTSDPMYSDPNYNIWSRSGKEFATADLMREIADLTRTANRANVTMYTIDPRGLVGFGDMDEQVDPVEWNNFIHNSQDTLRVLAEQTGGMAIINQNDYAKGLQRIDQETSDYYVIGYYSSNPDPTKRQRQIEVKVKRPDVQVWSRKGYQLKRQPTK